jgi:hypothetical protein
MFTRRFGIINVVQIDITREITNRLNADHLINEFEHAHIYIRTQTAEIKRRN